MKDRDGRIEAIFEAALELEQPEREAYVRKACAADSELCTEVLELLRADAHAADFLSKPAVSGDVARSVATDAVGQEALEDEIGSVLGSYRLLELLGRGGMGTVYLAQHADEDLGLRVALKIIRRGMDAEAMLQRFQRERRLLASLEHPNIARLLDGGSDEKGRPYLVVEYVEGDRIDDYCRSQGLSVRAKVELFLDVCAAVQHAHRNLIIHRDLKPQNILVNSSGVAKLLDFGIAKVFDPEIDDLALTMTTQRLYSPRYASPEQILGKLVTTSSDVYALGVVLYEILAGRSPYDGASDSLAEFEERVLREEPTPPSTACTTDESDTKPGVPELRLLQKSLRGDLDTIILKALRKNPERRYSSVDELAEDLRRYLDGQPVLARTDSLAYRTKKFLRRNLPAVISAAAIAVALIAATVVSSLLYIRAERDRQTAQEVSRFLEEMLGSIDPTIALGEDTELMRRVLSHAAERIDADLGDRPEVAGPLHFTIGTTYKSLGEYADAEHHLTRSRALGGARDPRSRLQLGALLWETDRFEEALDDLETTAQLARSEGDSISYARARYWIGKTHQATGARELARAALTESEAVLRRNSAVRERIQVLNGLGGFTLNYLHEYAAADSLYAIALALVQELELGPLVVGDQFQHIATAKRRLGIPLVADSLYAAALHEYERVLESDHPRIASLRDEWATLLEQQERWNDAEFQYSEAHRSAVAVYGERHSLVGTISNNYANLLRKTGRPTEAEPLYEQALVCYRENLGEEHAWVGIILGNVAANDLARGEAARALRRADECIRIRLLHWDSSHWRVATAEMQRGAALMEVGRADEAEAVLSASLSKLLEALGPDSAAVRQNQEYLQTLRERQGQPRQTGGG